MVRIIITMLRDTDADTICDFMVPGLPGLMIRIVIAPARAGDADTTYASIHFRRVAPAAM